MNHNQLHGQASTVVQTRTITGGVHLHTTRLHEPAPVPRQLPALRLFVDREQASAFLEHAWTSRHGPMRVGVEGPPGIGKTALITAWGHHRRGRWPHGTLYTDLARTSIDTALRGWLTALGHIHLPADPDHLRALWRTTTATRQLLVVAEHATADTAETLCPTGPGCAGITTAHHGLADLVASGGRYVRLPALSHDSVGELITRLLDHPVPAPLLQEAVASTSGVPLAATLTAAVLARDLTAPLTETAQENTVPDRVSALLNDLPENSVTTAAMIAAFPGPWVSADLVAHLMGASADQTHQVLDELVGAELVTEAGPGRHIVHDQVREPLASGLTPQARAHMVERLASFYRLRVAAVEQFLNPWRWRADTEGTELVHQAHGDQPWFTNRAEALAWMDGELDNLVAVAEMLQHDDRPEVWMVCDHIGTYMVLRKPAIAHTLYQQGLESARATGDGRAVGLMLQRLSTTVHPDYESALALNEEAKAAYEQAAYKQGSASAYEAIGSLLGRLGRLEEAEQTQIKSLRLHEEVGNRRGAAFQERRLGEIHALQGRTEEAQKEFVSSYRTLLALDPPDLYQATRNTQGLINLLLSQGAAADLLVAEMLTLQALATTQITGSRVQTASLYVNLADLARVREDQSLEISHLHQAVQSLQPGHPVADQAAARLSELGEHAQ